MMGFSVVMACGSGGVMTARFVTELQGVFRVTNL